MIIDYRSIRFDKKNTNNDAKTTFGQRIESQPSDNLVAANHPINLTTNNFATPWSSTTKPQPPSTIVGIKWSRAIGIDTQIRTGKCYKGSLPPCYSTPLSK